MPIRTVAHVRTVSVITAVDPEFSAWLPAAATSVHAATSWLARRGITLEWVLVIDGPGPLPKFRSGENTLLRRTAVRVGPAAAKNLAAVAAHGAWLVDLACDAELFAGALYELLSHQGMESVSWAAASAAGPVDLDGVRVTRPTAYPAGSLSSRWDRQLPFSPANLLVRKEAVLRCGGWPAVGALENLALLVRMNATEPGAAVAYTVFKTRDWEGRREHAPGWSETVTDARWTIANLLDADLA